MKTVVIFGTTSGLGFELSKILSESEVSLITVNRNLVLESNPGKIHGFSISYDLQNGGFDFSKVPEELLLNVKEVVLVLNAAKIAPLGSTIELSTSELEETFRNNFFGYISILQTFVGASRKFGYGLKIFWVGTGATDQIIPGWFAYSASKAALETYLLFIASENPAISIKKFEPGIFQSKIQDQISSFYSGKNQTTQELPKPEVAASILANLILD